VALSATPAAFSAPPGDRIAEARGWWERCQGGACAAIPGAVTASYIPTAADLGDQLVYVSAATAVAAEPAGGDLSHTTVERTPPSAAVLPPAGGASGGCGPCTQAPVGSSTPWRLRFTVHPRVAHRHSWITLAGRVVTRPLPPQGKLVLLQARGARTLSRGGRRRLAVGPWITFMVRRTNRRGAFRARYRFRLGGRHLYQFRAVAPAEGLLRNPSGASHPVSVWEL